MHDVKILFLDEPYISRSYADGIILRCVLDVEMLSVLEACTSRLWVGIIVVSRLPTRFCSVGIIGQPFTKMLMISPSHVIGSKEIEELITGKSSL